MKTESTSIYGHIEHRYCEPVAEALASDLSFAKFFLERAGRSNWSESFRCLKAEQTNLRSKSRFWWKNVFCHELNCTCPNLSGREVDIFTVFERGDGHRIGFHIECKQPKDKFSVGQAARYRERLSCWTQPNRGPRTIPRHEDAVAILLCDRDNSFGADELVQFNAVVFFDEIAKWLSPYPMPMI